MKPTLSAPSPALHEDAAPRRDRLLYRQLAMALGGVWEMRVMEVRPWASITFTGARHRLALRIADTSDNDARITTLPEHEFQLHGVIVADCCVTSRELVLMEDAEGYRRAIDLEIELLTIID